MTATRPKMPAGLGPSGKSLWRKLTTAFDFEVGEIAILEQAARMADDVTALEALIADQGMTVTGSQGQVRLHPALAEARQGRLALARMLGMLGMPDEEDKPVTAASRSARQAANARWSRKRQERERLEARLANGEA